MDALQLYEKYLPSVLGYAERLGLEDEDAIAELSCSLFETCSVLAPCFEKRHDVYIRSRLHAVAKRLADCKTVACYDLSVALAEGVSYDDMEDAVERRLFGEQVWLLARQVLSARQFGILTSYFRFDLTLSAIGGLYGVSRERVAQILRRSLCILRRKLPVGYTSRRGYYLR